MKFNKEIEVIDKLTESSGVLKNSDISFTGNSAYSDLYTLRLSNIGEAIGEMIISNDKNVKEVLLIVEEIVVNGSEAVKDAICTGLLESVMSVLDKKVEKYQDFITFLGPESKSFCKRWNEFNGINIPGL